MATRSTRLCLCPIRLELAAAFRHDGVQRIERLEVVVDDRFADKRPQPFSGLQVWRIGWQEDQTDTIRDTKIHRRVKVRVVENQDDAALASGAGLADESRQSYGFMGISLGSSQIRMTICLTPLAST